MEISKDDLYFILNMFDDRYRDDLNKTLKFVDRIFDTYHREKYDMNKENQKPT